MVPQNASRPSKGLIRICKAVVKGINTYVNKLKEPKHTIAKKAVKSYINTLNTFAGKFDKQPNKRTLGNNINDLIHWADKNKNKTISITFSKKKITIPIIDGQTMKNLVSIQGKLPNWMAHLPEHNIGLTLSGRILQYAKNTVNHALNDIAENIGKETAKMPHLKALSLTTELITILKKTNVLLTVTRNNTEKHFSVAFNFNNPAEATATLVDLIVKELPHW
jgi:hypothetical protein